jgi:hypothetical protein
MAKTAREDIIREVEQLPDDMIPEIANVLYLLKKKHEKHFKDKKTDIKRLIAGHRKAQALSVTSKIPWSEKIRENRADRI